MHDRGFIVGLDPLAFGIDVSESVNRAEDVLIGGAQGVRLLDDVGENLTEASVAKVEEASSVGVVIDGGFGLAAEAMHDDFGAAPLQERCLDLLAESVAADFAAEAVVFEVSWLTFAGFGGVTGEGGALRAG